MSLGTRFKKQFEQEVTVPYEGDLWGRQQLGERLTSFVEAIKDGMTIALDAEWGSGKTWFVRNWKAELEQKGFKVIYIDAFQHDFMEDPFLILSMEILNVVDANESVEEKFKEKFIKAYHAILPNMPMLLWSLTMTLMGAGHFSKVLTDTLNSIKDGSGDFGEKVGEMLEQKMQERLSEVVENYNTDKNELKYFQKALRSLVAEEEKPLVFIIDELDRCKPEFSIKLIERIKHFFDIPNIVFVLSTNKIQLCESINSYYGFTSANSYLEKFIDLNIKFPHKAKPNYEVVIENYRIKFGLEPKLTFDFSLIAKVLVLNSRDLIRILQKMVFLNLHNHRITPIIAFIYLAYEQKTMMPQKMTENEFLKIFVKNLRDYIRGDRFNGVEYDYENLEIFAQQYSENYYGNTDALPYLLKYYYVCNTNRLLNDSEQAIKRDKSPFRVVGKNGGNNFVQSWHDYINSGFMIS